MKKKTFWYYVCDMMLSIQNHPHREWLSSEQQQQHQEILQLFSNNSQRRGGFCLVMDWISENGFFFDHKSRRLHALYQNKKKTRLLKNMIHH